MAIAHGVRIGSSIRRLTLALLAIVGLLMIVPALAQSSRAGEVVAIRELELRTGVDLADFERFTTGTYNPGWEGAVPGMRGYIAKGDRGAQKGSYALVLIFDSEKTRNAIFPKEGGGPSESFTASWQRPLSLNKQLEKYIEPGALSVYTDYVALR